MNETGQSFISTAVTVFVAVARHGLESKVGRKAARICVNHVIIKLTVNNFYLT